MPPSDISSRLDDFATSPSGKSHVATSVLSAKRIRALVDRLAAIVVWFGGVATIISILGIFVYLLMEVVPLFLPAEGSEGTPLQVQPFEKSSPEELAIGVDEYQEVAYVLREGKLGFYHLASGRLLTPPGLSSISTEQVTAIAQSGGGGNHMILGTHDGRILPLKIQFKPIFENGVRTIVPDFSVEEPIEIDLKHSPIKKIAYQRLDEGMLLSVITQSGNVLVSKVEEGGGLLSEGELMVRNVELDMPEATSVSALLLDQLGDQLVVATKEGGLFQWDLREFETPTLISTSQVHPPEDSLTAMEYLIGDRTIILGTKSGKVSAWMLMGKRDRAIPQQWTKVRSFTEHSGAVTAISPSQRDKGFVTADSQGNVSLRHLTSGQTIFEFPGGGMAIQKLTFAPKANGMISLDTQGQLRQFTLENPHPEITMQTLFAPVLYEGYERPENVWQSSSGSDDFEPKLGMWPLIFGTLKGTIYAMCLAVPLAVMGAIYTAMFMSRELRAIVKPVIEIMAALPSVVLGFLAGLWFAPLLERIFPAVLAMVVFMPVSVILACVLWQFIPKKLQGRNRWGLDLGVMGLVLLGTAWLCLSGNHLIESWWFGGDYKQWLAAVFDLQYDQRNALVISFAMGFAVIPIIFSISEDSISNVPKHLLAGSLALGATPWQTLTKLVLVSASPGIFSALMIGFGRAIGETMIVLMATGNTPIMEWSIFNGFRTLSANIAVEMPEAPHGGTLYRVLFLAGLLLFAFTFAINTFAEIIRQRLRAKYSQY